MTLLTIRTQVRYLIGDVLQGSATDGRFWLNAELLTYINEAQRQISGALQCLETYETADSLASTQLYDLPSNFYMPKAVEYMQAAGEQYKPLQRIDVHELQGISGGNPTNEGTPRCYYLIEPGLNQIGLYPVPATAVASGIKIFLWKMPAALATDGESSSLPSYLQDLIAYYAASKAYIKRRDLNMQASLENQYEKLLAKYAYKIQPTSGKIKDEDDYSWL